MEYGLRLSRRRHHHGTRVLILVIMEYGLRQQFNCLAFETGLNPCCNGIWPQTAATTKPCAVSARLNPCCNGIWPQTCKKRELIELCKVLILVVMEYGLRLDAYKDVTPSGLNPCCNGIWSQTAMRVGRNIKPE